MFRRGGKSGGRKGRKGRKVTGPALDKLVRDALKAEGIKGQPSPDALKKIQKKIADKTKGNDDGDHFRDA